MYGRYDTYAKIFQSTPPVWAETVHHPFFKITKRFQSTPPVWAETSHFGFLADLPDISIHSARVGGDDYSRPLVFL